MHELFAQVGILLYQLKSIRSNDVVFCHSGNFKEGLEIRIGLVVSKYQDGKGETRVVGSGGPKTC